MNAIVSPPRPVRIAPSILSADFARLGDEVREVDVGGADWIHVDVMDGHFVPNLTIGPLVVKAIRRITALPLDVHLMIENADRYVEAFAEAGADIVTVHVEADRHLHRTLSRIRQLGARPGVALNPATPAESVLPVLADVDVVLVMSVNPGFGGQAFIPRVLEKVRILRGWITEGGHDVELSIDGGIDAATIGLARAAGANVFVAGSAVFGQAERANAIAGLRLSAERTSG